MNINLTDKLYKSKYYIYEHYLDGELFYIGKGTGKRAIDLLNRSELWKTKVNKRESDVEVKIIAHFYDNVYAKIFEKLHIKNAVESNIELVNITYNEKLNGNYVSYDNFQQSFPIRNLDPNFQYKTKHKKTINHLKQLDSIFIDFKNKYSNTAKGLIFSANIKSMKDIEMMLKVQGFNPLSIWSTNNEHNILTKEQLEARSELINIGKIPEPYDFLIFNQSLFKHLDLKDDSIEMIIVNVSAKEMHKYIRTLVKKDIDILVYRTEKKTSEVYIELPDKFLNRSLDKNDKEELCLDLNIVDNRGILAKWERVKKILINNDYIVDDKTITIKKKRTRVSVISKDDENED